MILIVWKVYVFVIGTSRPSCETAHFAGLRNSKKWKKPRKPFSQGDFLKTGNQEMAGNCSMYAP
jgi:hypothetical protein